MDDRELDLRLRNIEERLVIIENMLINVLEEEEKKGNLKNIQIKEKEDE